MIALPTDPIWDELCFSQGFARRAVSLRTLVNHAREIGRSDPAIHIDLIYYPAMQRDASALLAAWRLDAPTEHLLDLAEMLNDTLCRVRDAKAMPKPSKPTVGKAKDRLGEKQRREADKQAQRAERRALSKPAPSLGPLWGEA